MVKQFVSNCLTIALLFFHKNESDSEIPNYFTDKMLGYQKIKKTQQFFFKATLQHTESSRDTHSIYLFTPIYIVKTLSK